jgi:hypothetical protein
MTMVLPAKEKVDGSSDVGTSLRTARGGGGRFCQYSVCVWGGVVWCGGLLIYYLEIFKGLLWKILDGVTLSVCRSGCVRTAHLVQP